MLLSDKAIKAAKPKAKVYRLNDGDGLFFQVEPTGKKLWRFRYFFNGKETMMSLGSFPEVTLAEARDKRHEANKLLSNGINPYQKKQEEKRNAIIDLLRNSFKYPLQCYK